jgi:hypothetical protein
MENLLPPGQQNTSRVEVVIPIFVPIIVGLSLVIAAGIAAYAFYATHALDNVLSVTGSATQEVTSDTAVWTIDIERKADENTMQSGYLLLAKDLVVVQAYLKAQNVPDGAVTVSQVFTEEIYKQNDTGPTPYNLRQEITVNSKDVQGINTLAKNITALAAQGIFISQNQLAFYVSNLPDLRVSLLADAIKDAKARASEIAKAGGQSVGVLRSASSGVVQVLPPNSTDVSDYGSYDTGSIVKEVMVTAHASFAVK